MMFVLVISQMDSSLILHMLFQCIMCDSDILPILFEYTSLLSSYIICLKCIKFGGWKFSYINFTEKHYFKRQAIVKT